ncbi:MAG: hypothetical protein MI741_20350, partial [Rhodospirillales bacterium]|nr:hypothetical protein [Rhodospirillales bacterium]
MLVPPVIDITVRIAAANNHVRGSFESQLQLIRAQLELYQVQHNGDYPDLVNRGWLPMTHQTDISGKLGKDFGPYVMSAQVVNQFTQSAVVVDDRKLIGSHVGWYYNYEKGVFCAVVPWHVARRYGLNHWDVVAY